MFRFQQSKEEVQAVVCKTGGDLVRMGPAEAWQVQRFLSGAPGPEECERAQRVQVREDG
jgi:hypothetical protein